MDWSYDYEEEHEVKCPHCKRRSKHIIRDTVYIDLEPPERDEP